jgi:hypothetical protein
LFQITSEIDDIGQWVPGGLDGESREVARGEASGENLLLRMLFRGVYQGWVGRRLLREDTVEVMAEDFAGLYARWVCDSQ